MCYSKWVLCLVCIILALGSHSFGDIPIPSHITDDTTWDITTEPYLLTGSLTIESGATLTISPGVYVTGSTNWTRTNWTH